ncbi:hypothetical protein PV325_006313 [Microctonus aethiopoides]|nr:hypothetical protein PV325_006313 [Microctonus aethiopoides]
MYNNCSDDGDNAGDIDDDDGDEGDNNDGYNVVDEMVQKDLPQAIQLFGEMNTSVDRVNQLIDMMLSRIKNDEISTAKGLSFLEVKYQMLLSYLINLTYIVLRKSSGEQIDGDPSIERLIEIRTVLEKIRPIDYKLKYQVDKLVKSTVMGATGEINLTSFKANPDAFVGKIEDSNEEDSDEVDDEKTISNTKKLRKSGVYAPPKLAAVHYDGDETISEKMRNAGDRNRKRAVSTAILRELKEEYLDAPIEDSQASERKMSLSRENKRKIEYEENYMTRLPVGKQEKHRNRQFSTLNTLGDEITTFGGSLSSKNKRKRNNDKGKKRFKKKRFT